METDMPNEVRADRPIPAQLAQTLVEIVLGKSGPHETCPYAHRISQPVESSNVRVLHLRHDMTRYGALTYTEHMLNDRPFSP